MARTQGSHALTTGPKLREAALRLFAQKGYAAVSMRQIAAEVGVQVGALYNYTEDKQFLLFDLLQSHMQDLMAAWQVAQAGLMTPSQRLEAFTRFHIRYHLTRTDAVFISYMELRNLTPENFTKIETLRHAYESQLQSILTEGQASGDFDLHDSKITALAVIAMLNGVLTWFRSDGRLSLDRVEGIYWNMVRRAVGCAP